MDKDTAERVLGLSEERQRVIDFAWAAGLFEGEGSFTLMGKTVRSGRFYLELQITSTDEDVIRKFHRVIGVGNVYGPYEHGGPRKPCWRWAVVGRKALSIATDEEFVGHLCSRRAARLAELMWEITLQKPSRLLRGHDGRCGRGHSLDDAYINNKGCRVCKPCTLDRQRVYRERKRVVRQQR